MCKSRCGPVREYPVSYPYLADPDSSIAYPTAVADPVPTRELVVLRILRISKMELIPLTLVGAERQSRLTKLITQLKNPFQPHQLKLFIQSMKIPKRGP